MIRLRINYTGLPGGVGLNVLHFNGVSGAQAEEAQAFVSDLAEAWSGFLWQEATMTGDSEAEIISAATGDLLGVEPVTPFTFPGENVGQPLPSSNQLLIRWRTGVIAGGRRILGKTFLAGPTEDTNIAGFVPPAAVAALDTFLAAAIGGLSAGNELVVYSPKNGAAYPVVSGSVWDQWAILRRRRQ